MIDFALHRIAPAVEFQGDVRSITPSEITAVESYLRRRTDIPEHPRQWLAWRISVPLLQKIRPVYDPANFNYEGFLEEILARYRVESRYRT
ncbi:MAG: hypothetical protein IPJ07_16295 [Acidobacteria bacterium]|nr:hypothetical protein [Acidobacteriota bacterium]